MMVGGLIAKPMAEQVQAFELSKINKLMNHPKDSVGLKLGGGRHSGGNAD
jgi:hypothetical protein